MLSPRGGTLRAKAMDPKGGMHLSRPYLLRKAMPKDLAAMPRTKAMVLRGGMHLSRPLLPKMAMAKDLSCPSGVGDQGLRG